MHEAESYPCLASINYVASAQQVPRLCDNVMAVAHIDFRMLNYPDPRCFLFPITPFLAMLLRFRIPSPRISDNLHELLTYSPAFA
jgi:hypothetical protein